MLRAFILLTSTFLVFSFIHYASKSKKPFKRAFVSMLSGALALTGLDLMAGFTGVFIPVTYLSLGISVVGGIPGVALMVFLGSL